MMQKLDLHLRHVDAGRAFAPATLATEAKIHGFEHRVRHQCIAAELPGQGQTKGIGAAAGQVLLVAGGAI